LQGTVDKECAKEQNDGVTLNPRRNKKIFERILQVFHK
jgi:hypothetical protein